MSFLTDLDPLDMNICIFTTFDRKTNFSKIENGNFFSVGFDQNPFKLQKLNLPLMIMLRFGKRPFMIKLISISNDVAAAIFIEKQQHCHNPSFDLIFTTFGVYILWLYTRFRIKIQHSTSSSSGRKWPFKNGKTGSVIMSRSKF